MLHRNLKLSWMPLARMNFKYFSFIQSPSTSSPQRIDLYNSPPEANKVNYKEFQEPLIGHMMTENLTIFTMYQVAHT